MPYLVLLELAAAFVMGWYGSNLYHWRKEMEKAADDN